MTVERRRETDRRRTAEVLRTAWHRPPKCPTLDKVSYPDELTAYRYALRWSARFGKPCRVFQCEDCPYLHITTRKAWVRDLDAPTSTPSPTPRPVPRPPRSGQPMGPDKRPVSVPSATLAAQGVG